MKNLRSTTSLLAITILFFALPALADTATGSFEKDLKVTGKADLEVFTGSGNITVRSGETSNVHIIAKIRARDDSDFFGNGNLSAQEKVRRIEANPPVVQQGNHIVVGRIEDKELRNNISISYEITVPAETQLRSESGSGDERIVGIEGPVTAHSGSGSIMIAHIGNNARVETGSGDVDIENIKGRLTVQTGSGTVKAMNVGGAFDGQTGSGDITLDQSAGGDVVARTGSGSVRLRHVRGGVEAHTGSGDIEADGEVTSSWRMHTGSGSIDLHLSQNANFDLDAETGSGGVSTSHPVTIQGTVKRNRLQGKVGTGGPMVRLDTGSGRIKVD